MNRRSWYSVARSFLLFTGTSALLLSYGCGGGGGNQPQTSVPQTSVTTAANSADANKSSLPLRGKVQKSSPPVYAAFGMIYINTADNREYIYDGTQWVPHDATADNFYKTKTSKTVAASVQTLNSLNGGAHEQHGSYGCESCHRVDWTNGLQLFWFDNPSSPAIGAGMPSPVFNDVNKTCSSVACHSMPTGLTFSYYYPDETGEPVLRTVDINSNPSATTPNWYSTGAGCAACHGSPPVNGSNGSNIWHSGQHASGIPGANECQLCHPDASSPGNGIGDTITNSSLHATGTVNVQATFKTVCFGCH